MLAEVPWRRAAPAGSSLLIASVILCAFVVSTNSRSAATTNDADESGASKLKIEGGWAEVKQGWPKDAEDYFLATEKGHHFVESQGLPMNLKHDLLVTFEYYYSYSKTRPVLQMTPCTSNIYLMDDRPTTEDKRDQWVTHRHRVRRADCAKRNAIAYNVLLHDPGDIFAWKIMKIESITSEQSASPSPAPVLPRDETKKPADDQSGTTPDPLIEIIDQAGTQGTLESTPQPESVSPSKPRGTVAPENLMPPFRGETDAPPVTQKLTTDMLDYLNKRTTPKPKTPLSPAPETKPQTTPAPEPETFTKPESVTTPVPESGITLRPTEGITSPAPEPETTPRPTEAPTTLRSPAEDVLTTTRPLAPNDKLSADDEKRDDVKESRRNRPRDGDDVDPSDASLNLKRRKRAVLSEINDDDDEDNGAARGELVNALCVPSSCNKDLFRMARFSPLVKGLPKRPPGTRPAKYFVNLRNQPLGLKIESHDEPLSEVDTCVGFKLYMEAGAELELLMAEQGTDGTKSQDKLLELIKRKSADSTAGRWDDFSRCISDYMPAYKPPKSGNPEHEKGEDSMRLILRPRGAQKPGQVAMLINEEGASYLANLHQKQSFLPDVKRMGSAEQFTRYWVVDRDGLAKPELAQTSSGANVADKKLQITHIDPTQEIFDLTSRWLQIRDAETLELPVQFVYRAERADWIQRVDFEFQRASDPTDKWISQTAYRAPVAATPTTDASPTTKPNSTSDKDKKALAGPVSQASPGQASRLIEMPIHVTGLDSSEFRLRLRHYMKPEVSGTPGANTGHTSLSDARGAFVEGRTLNITALAFADACAYGRPFCRNNGECRPRGPAQAECVCPQGFSGRFCEHVRPCEVIYTAAGGNKLTGEQLCRSVGARCIDQLPVMRCEWPNDRFYQCKKLYRLDASGQGYTPIGGASGGDQGAGDDDQAGGGDLDANEEERLRQRLNKLQGVVGQQAKLIIILAVFIIAILIFAVVLLGSMVSRLRRSSQRLKKSQGEVHELSRRAVHPGGFGGSLARGPAASSSGAPKPGSSSGGRFDRTKSASPASGYNNSAFDVES